MKYLGLHEAVLIERGAIHTAKEIVQQPASWVRVLAMCKDNWLTIENFLKPILEMNNLRIILAGAGTSAFAGTSIASSLSRSLHKRVDAIATTELVSNPGQHFQPDIPTLLVSFARSGNSPESVAAVEFANAQIDCCFHLVLTCNTEGALYQHCVQHENSLALLMPEETNDKSFAMTSSFSTMLLAAILIFMGFEAYSKRVSVIASVVEDLISKEAAFLESIADKLFARVVYLGSNCLKGLSQEASLKLLELTDGETVTTFDSPLGFRHGPKSIVDSDTLVVVYISNDPYTRKYDLDLLRELRTDGETGQVLAITARKDDEVTQGDYLLVDNMEDATDIELLFPYIACAQIYAFHHSLRLGHKPDSPSASGTVNRVVKGVTIHKL